MLEFYYGFLKICYINRIGNYKEQADSAAHRRAARASCKNTILKNVKKILNKVNSTAVAGKCSGGINEAACGRHGDCDGICNGNGRATGHFYRGCLCGRSYNAERLSAKGHIHAAMCKLVQNGQRSQQKEKEALLHDALYVRGSLRFINAQHAFMFVICQFIFYGLLFGRYFFIKYWNGRYVVLAHQGFHLFWAKTNSLVLLPVVRRQTIICKISLFSSFSE